MKKTNSWMEALKEIEQQLDKKSFSHRKSNKKKIRPLGDIMFDLEDIITEMVESHSLENGEILNLINGYLEIHFPDNKETYLDNSHPIFYYGPKK